MDASSRPASPSRKYAYHLAVQATLRDTDGVGHVNNAVYLSWCEEVRTRYVYERHGLTDMAQLDFILASARLDFRSPVLLHEVVDLWCSPSRVGRSSWDMVYEGRAQGNGRLVVEASSVQVQYDYAIRAVIAIPADWRARLEADVLALGVLP